MYCTVAPKCISFSCSLSWCWYVSIGTMFFPLIDVLFAALASFRKLQNPDLLICWLGECLIDIHECFGMNESFCVFVVCLFVFFFWKFEWCWVSWNLKHLNFISDCSSGLEVLNLSIFLISCISISLTFLFLCLFLAELVSSLPNASTEMSCSYDTNNVYERIRLQKLAFVHRAVSISTDPNGCNFAVLQSDPKTRYFNSCHFSCVCACDNKLFCFSEKLIFSTHVEAIKYVVIHTARQ